MEAGKIPVIIIAICFFYFHLDGQNKMITSQQLTSRQQTIIQIAALTARGSLQALKPALNKGLDAGLTINEIKEVLVHLYAYCGFPRSIRGLQTFMEVLDERKTNGITDKTGPDASPVNDETNKYERGMKVLSKLTKNPQEKPSSGYGAFAPVIDIFLKEHLFADIFERDVLTYAERELVTISVISAIGNAEPMLRSHLAICLNVGITPGQLNEFVGIIYSTIGRKEAKSAKAVLSEVLKSRQLQGNVEKKTNDPTEQNEPLFAKGNKITNNNFTGTAWLHMFVNSDSIYNTSIGYVTFEPKARTNWHQHPGGQILLVTDGRGYYQEKGKPAQRIKKGDVVKIPPFAEHWHGAAPDSGLTHIAISLNTDKGSAVWLQPVSDAEFNQSEK